MPAYVAQRAINQRLGGPRLVLHDVRRPRQVRGETVDGPDQLLRILALEEILVQTAFDEHQLFRARAASVEKFLGHPLGTDLVRRSLNEQRRYFHVADEIFRVEKPAADEMDGNARKRDARKIRQIRERRLKNESVEWMTANHLRRDGAAEREAVENRRKVLRANLVV